MSIMGEIMSTTPTTTTTTPDVVDELINYYVVNPPKCNSLIVKPLGAFKESPYFVALITGFTSVSGNLCLTILSDSIFSNDNLSCMFTIFCVELICSDLKKAINEAVNILREITFCKVDGEFKRPNEKSTQGHLYHIFNRLWDMQVDIECCVCKETTTTKTACGHRLCLICWSNINGIVEKDYKTPRCPMCRENIRYKEKWVDDNDDESD